MRIRIPDDVKAAIKKVFTDRLKPEKLQDVDVAPWVDHLGVDSLKIHVYVDKDTTREDLTDDGLDGSPMCMQRQVMEVLTGDLEGLYPYIRVVPR